jgi:hypothetical protein
LIVVGVLSILASLASCGVNIFSLIPLIEVGAPPDQLGGVVFGIFQALLGVVCGGVIIAGGAKLMKGESYNLSMAAAVLAMVPCCSGICCIAGLPIGIWAIVSMTKVKDQFR